MSLFLYYASHSFVNQLKKLFKTWVLVFILICALMGGLIGIFAAKVEEKAEENFPDDPPAEEIAEPEEEGPSFFETAGVSGTEVTELGAGAVILAMFAFFTYSADKNGSRIFLPADVALLFSSPMKPQSVLMFRVVTQLGAVLAASLYMLFQLPNFIINFGMSTFAALALILSWILTAAISTLLQVLCYLLAASKPAFRPYIRRIIFGVLLIAAAGYIFTLLSTKENYLRSAVLFFNGKYSRLIPFWGWIKGICMYAIEGRPVQSALCTAAVLAGGAALVFIIRHIKADFYEDAMARSEETAALIEKAQSDKNTGVTVAGKKKKDRDDKLERDGMKHGWGANVFFHKAMYNRFRFAHLHFFTKTMETYIGAAVIVGLILRFAAKSVSPLPLVLVLSGLVFFRSLGNPLEEDVNMDYFVLIPESTWAKMFWSLAGSAVNCLLDLLPAVIIGCLILGGNLLNALVWVPFILSVNIFATTVGAFIGFSVPVPAGKNIKQFAQILFVYFGMLPDAMIIVIGIVSGYTALSAVITAVVNLGLAAIFFFLSPLFIDPRGGRIRTQAATNTDLKAAKKTFSTLGLGCFAILAVSTALQIAVSMIMSAVYPEWTSDGLLFWVCSFAPIYLTGVPVGYLIMRKIPVCGKGNEKFSPGRFAVIAVICIFMMYAGNIIGTVVTSLLSVVMGHGVVNTAASVAMNSDMLPRIIVMVILAPVIEEFVFRKLLIDRMRNYGEKLAVVTSALMFGLFHGNFSQLFYAFGLGLVFGYVYLKSGRLRYSVGLHMTVNFLGSVLAPWLLSRVFSDNDISPAPGIVEGDIPNFISNINKNYLIALIVYLFVMLILTLVGFVLFCIKVRGVKFSSAKYELPSGAVFRTVYLNAGMILLILACAGLTVYSLI